jgi:hypothetical protein
MPSGRDVLSHRDVFFCWIAWERFRLIRHTAVTRRRELTRVASCILDQPTIDGDMTVRPFFMRANQPLHTWTESFVIQ